MAYDIRFNVGQTGADTIDQITAKMTVMKAQITATGLEMRQAGNRVADAQKQIAEGAAFIAPLLAKEQAVLDGLVIKQREQKAALDALTPAIEKTTAATVQATTATAKLSAAHTAMVPQVAAASAAIRTFEGALPIRAVERFAVNVLGLGPLLQTIFPVVGLLAFGEVILRTGEKILKMSGLWGGVTKAEQEATAEAKRMDDQIKQIGASIAAVNLQKLTIRYGGTAAKATVSAQGPANELEAQRSVDAAYADLATQLRKTGDPRFRREVTAGRSVLVDNLEGNDAIQKALNEADETAAGGNNPGNGLTLDAYRQKVRALEPFRKAVQAAQELKEQFHAQSGLEARQTMQSSREETQAQYNTVTEQENAAAAQRKQREEAAKEVRTRSEDRARSTAELGRKELSPVEAIYARDEETRRDFAAKGNAFTPADILRRNAGVTADANAELKKQADAQRNQFSDNGQLINKNKHDQVSTLGPEGENDLKRVGELILSNLKEYNAEHNKQVTETGAAAVKQNAIRGASADKLIERNPELGEAQKIAAIHSQDLETQKQKLRMQLESASHLATEKEIDEATFQAKKSDEEELTKIKEDNLDKLAALEDKHIQEFRGLIGGLFDAATSHSPNAIPNFVKGQVLKVGQTITENAAQAYLLPAITKLIPTTPGGALGAILKGTGLTKDPLQPAGTQLYSAGTQLIAAARALAMSRTGGGGGMPGGGGGTAGVDSAGNVLPGGGDIGDGLPMSAGPWGTANAPISSVGSGGGFGFNGGTIASIAGAAAGSIVAAKDFSAGGVGKDLQGAGAVAGITAAIIPLIPALTAAFPPAGAIAAVAAVGLSMIGSFINAPQRRANAINTELGQAQYIAPQALNATQDSSGDFTDFDARGNIRTSNFSAIPTVRQGSTWEQTHGLFGGPPTFYTVPGGQTSQFGAPNGGTTAPAPPPQTVIINAMDSQSFNDFAEKNHMAIGNAASKAMQNGHGALTTEVQRAANP